MIRPLIGITVGRFLDKDKRKRIGCGPAYINEVALAGGSVVLLPPVAEDGSAQAMIEAVDGLLFAGGGDVHGSEFGQPHHPKANEPDRDRDRLELEAARLGAKRGLPMLGICRGIQLLNIALGGDLIQDIPSLVTTDTQHDSKRPLAHTIAVERKSLIASLIGPGTVEVNSRHHQALGRMARGLRVAARASDGIIEAVEADDGRPILGVQFHPEDIAADYPKFRTIFEWLVTQARRFRRSPAK